VIELPAITDLPIWTDLGYELRTQGTTDTTPTTYTYSGSLNGYVFKNDGGVNISLGINGGSTVTVIPGEVVNAIIPIASFTINAASGVSSWTMRAFEQFGNTGVTSALATLQKAAVATGNGTVLDVSNYSTLVLNIVFSGTATVVTESSVDGTNWDVINGYSLVSGFVNIQVSSLTTNSRVRFHVGGLKYFRARISSWTSGTVDVLAECTSATGVFTPNTVLASDAQSTAGYHPVNAGYLYGFNGTNWDRLRTGGTGILKANLNNSSGTEILANSFSDGSSGSNALPSALVGYNGATFERIRTVNTGQLRTTIYSTSGTSADVFSTNSDGVLAAYGLVTYTYPYLYNGSTFDRARNNLSGTSLASASRTSTANSGIFTNYNHRGIVLILNVTTASGTGGLQVQIQTYDFIGAVYKAINTAPTAVTTTGQYVYMLYPGVDSTNSNNAQNVSQVLPQQFRVSVTHGDSSSYTYSVSYQMIL
jgi:hypothetical protein